MPGNTEPSVGHTQRNADYAFEMKEANLYLRIFGHALRLHTPELVILNLLFFS